MTSARRAVDAFQGNGDHRGAGDGSGILIHNAARNEAGGLQFEKRLPHGLFAAKALAQPDPVEGKGSVRSG